VGRWTRTALLGISSGANARWPESRYDGVIETTFTDVNQVNEFQSFRRTQWVRESEASFIDPGKSMSVFTREYALYDQDGKGSGLESPLGGQKRLVDAI
jgi:hypothetical protein